MLFVAVSEKKNKTLNLIKNKIWGDHIHCCPTNHTCDIEKGHCKRQIDDQLKNNQCPDGIFFD
jgi:hypothetical protein